MDFIKRNLINGIMVCIIIAGGNKVDYSLEKLIENFKKHEGYYKSKANKYNKHATRVEYIDPFLKLLGWDIENTKGVKPNRREVIPENYSRRGNRQDNTETLKVESKLFIKAKKISIYI